MKPKMFISSSSEASALAHAAHQNLQAVAEITVWDQGAVKPSSTVMESLEDYLSASDFALFVFNADDTVTVRGKENPAVRDNVIFELGLFAGRLGKDRCFILVPDGVELRVPTDLLGITLPRYEAFRSDNNLVAATGPACYQVKEAIGRLGSRVQLYGSPAIAPEAQAVEGLEASVGLSGEEDLSESQAAHGGFEWLVLYLRREFDQSIDLLQKKLADDLVDDDRMDLQAWVGRINFEKDPRQGEVYLRRLIEERPEVEHAYTHLAYAFRRRQRYREALAVLDEGLASVGDRSSLLVAKASILDGLGRREEVQALLKQGISEFPESSTFYGELADHHVEVGDYGPAREVLEDGLLKVAERESILAKLAHLLHEHFDQESALVRYNDLLILKPESPVYLALRANILLDLSFFDLALRDYRRANELAQEKQAWILANIGNLFNSRGLYHEAIPYFKQALALESDDEYSHERLAQALQMRAEEEKKFLEICKQGRLRLVQYGASGTE